MTWIVFAIISLLLTVSYGLVAKKALGNQKTNFDPIAYASAMFVFVGAITLILWFFSGKVHQDIASLSDPKIATLAAIVVVIYSLAPSLYYRALKKLPFSIITIVYSLSGLFAFFIGLVFKINTFNFLALLGSVLIISSVVLISFKSSEIKASRYLLLMFLATFFYSLAAIVDSQLVSHFSSSFYISLTFGAPGILILLINFVSPKKIVEPYKRKNYFPIALNASIVGFSYLFIFNAYHAGGSAAQIYSILAMEAILSVIFAAIFLKERKDLFLKLVAAIIAGIGVYFLTR